MHIQDIFRQHPTTFSFEFFPPKTDEASEELFRTIAQPAGAAAVVRLGHLRRRRLDPRADPRPGRPHPARDQPDRRLAPDLRLPHARRAGRDPRPLRRLGHREHPGPRRRPAAEPGRLRPRRRTPSSTPSDLVAFIRSRDERAATRAASASAWPASPRGTRPRRTGSRRWTT